MALYKKQDLRIVPWMSFDEWNDVYKQVFSNEVVQQKQSYNSLLVWKARTYVLPAGVECTLELLEVCLRDREWSEKIDNAEIPMHYEKDLQRLYSTAIMRFLNHICHLGKTKSNSLYKICEKINIPNWIVDLRHDAAHSHELPPLPAMRNATNILLAWLHNEYWIIEYKNMKRELKKNRKILEDKTADYVMSVIELWIATGLYIKSGYNLIEEIPNDELRKSLIKLICSKDDAKSLKNYTNIEFKRKDKNKSINLNDLHFVQKFLLSEITEYIVRMPAFNSNCTKIICDTLIENDVFLPNSEFLQIFTSEQSMSQLPTSFLAFWKDFILYLQEKNILQPLFLRLYKVMNNENANKTKRLMASLWISALIRATIKQKRARNIAFLLEQVLDANNKKIKNNSFNAKIENQLIRIVPELENVLSLNYHIDIMNCLKHEEFLKEIVINADEYSVNFISDLMHMIDDLTENQKKDILEILDIVTHNVDASNDSFSDESSEEDFQISDNEEVEIKVPYTEYLDLTVRNTNWKLSNDNVNWNKYPFGILPWQNETSHTNNAIEVPAIVVVPKESVSFSPGFLDVSLKKAKSQINWSNVMKSKTSNKRKSISNGDNSIKKTKCNKKM